MASGRWLLGCILAAFIIFLSVPIQAVADDGDTAAGVSAPSPENFIYTGSATYKIPIEVPPGRRGVTPNISLTYNSSQGGGWLGVGWNLDMGSIQRSTKRGVNYGGDQYVAVINGATLELAKRDDWGPHYYGAKIEGAFYKFYKNPTTGGWEVTTKDGAKYYYGTHPSIYDPSDQSTSGNGGFNSTASRQNDPYFPADSTRVFRWLLDKVQDANGNYMTITYMNFFGTLYLWKIDYTGNADSNNNVILPTTSRIIFDQAKDVDTGYELDAMHNLRIIRIYADGNLVRKYDLRYIKSGNTGRSLLRKIFLYSSDGATSLFYENDGTTARPIVNLTYQTTYDGFDQPVDFPFSTDGALKILTGDFNGDGRADIAVVDASGVKIYTSGADGFHNEGRWLNIPACTNYLYCNTYDFYTGDFDGDGRADIMVASWDYQGNPLPSLVYYSDGTWFSSPVQLDGFNKGAGITTGDFNGDGRADIAAGTTVYISQGRSFSQAASWATGWASPLVKVYAAGDFNGDGKADLLVKGIDYNGTSYIDYSTGIALAGSKTTYPFNLDNLIPGDFNGDGRTDFASLHFAFSTYQIDMSLSKGKDFESRDVWINSTSASAPMAVAGDFDGDGKADLFVRSEDSNGSVSAQIYYTINNIPDLLTTVENGIGGKTSIVYQPSTQYSNTYLPLVVQVVSSITTNDGNGHSYTTNYDYADGYYDAGSREFRGFGYVKQTNPDNTKTETSFYQDDIFKGLAYDVKVWDSAGSLYSETFNSYDYVVPNTGIYFPRLWQKYDNLFDGSSTSPKGTAVSFEYDGYGNVTRRHSSGDATVSGDEKDENTEYHTDPVLDADLISNWIVSLPSHTYIKDSAGTIQAQSWFDYYSNGNLKAKTAWLKADTNDQGKDNPQNPKISYEYDLFGNLNKITDANGYVTSMVYDSNHIYATTTTNPIYSTSATYDNGTGKPTTKTDANGNKTSYYYDLFGRLTLVISPLDSAQYPTTTYGYLNFGDAGTQNVKTCSRVNTGQTNVLCKETYFDGLGRTTGTRSDGPDGKQIATYTTYDTVGRVEKKSLPYFEGTETPRETVFEYDNVSRPRKVTNPDGTYSMKLYSQWTTTIVDANSHQKVEVRDAYGRLVEVDEYSGVYPNATPYSATTYQYDVLNNLTKVTDANGNVTTINYDTLSRKTSMNDPDMGYWLYPEYDANGNLKRQIDAKGQTITFDYDAVNRVLHKYYPAGTPVVTYTYDAYDDGSTTNAKGKLTKVVDESGTTVFSYDQVGRITNTDKTVNGVSYSPTKAAFSTATTYDALGRTTSVTYPDNDIVNYQYNAGALLKATDTSGAVKYAEYTGYNALGQVGTVTYGNHVTTDYKYYGTNNRLETIKTALGTSDTYLSLSYVYDSVGNITSRINLSGDEPAPDIATATYDYTGYNCNQPHGPHAVTNVGAKSYCYDANGNMTGSGMQTITYNYDNMPVLIGNTTFVYDYSGQRVKKTTGSSTTVYIGKLFECAISDGLCVDAKKHIFAGNTRIATKTATDTFYFHADHLGSSTVITNGSGIKVQEIKYAAFGEERFSWKDAGYNGTNYKFTGQEEDPEIGLYYYGARYYDPTLGKFISPDSEIQDESDPQNLNRYAYCINNPLLYTDPTGHNFLKSFISGLVSGMLFVLTEGTYGIIGAGMIAGVGGGMTSGALSGGGIDAIIMGGATGGVMGGIGGALVSINPSVMGPALLLGGATYAGATGGLNGLADFAGGVLGGIVGYSAGKGLLSASSAAKRDQVANAGEKKSDAPLKVKKDCLELIFNDKLDNVNVIKDPLFVELHGSDTKATTRFNNIYVKNIADFWNDAATVIEEYYHVEVQWKPNGIKFLFQYLYEGIINGYENNIYENNAKDFVSNNLKQYKNCIKCLVGGD